MKLKLRTNLIDAIYLIDGDPADPIIPDDDPRIVDKLDIQDAYDLIEKLEEAAEEITPEEALGTLPPLLLRIDMEKDEKDK